MPPEEVVIRQYQEADRDCVRDIAWDTTFIGQPADAIFDDKEVLADFLTGYFTDYEPESCFVAQANNRVIGYLVGSRNTSALEKVFRIKILPRLLLKSLIKGTLFKKGNFIFVSGLVSSFLNGEFKMPALSGNYPATLHINLEEGFRDLGIGSKLMDKYLNYLIRKRVPGVFLATMSDRAANFFGKHGFSLLHQGRRSYFRFILNKDVPVYIYGKKLLA